MWVWVLIVPQYLAPAAAAAAILSFWISRSDKPKFPNSSQILRALLLKLWRDGLALIFLPGFFGAALISSLKHPYHYILLDWKKDLPAYCRCRPTPHHSLNLGKLIKSWKYKADLESTPLQDPSFFFLHIPFVHRRSISPATWIPPPSDLCFSSSTPSNSITSLALLLVGFDVQGSFTVGCCKSVEESAALCGWRPPSRAHGVEAVYFTTCGEPRFLLRAEWSSGEPKSNSIN